MQMTETKKLTSIAAKILECRKPSRTKTESTAQPIAEKIATISAGILLFFLHQDGKHHINSGVEYFQATGQGRKIFAGNTNGKLPTLAKRRRAGLLFGQFGLKGHLMENGKEVLAKVVQLRT